MPTRDELLLGAEPTPQRAPDTDGDGVSDAQESLDGTNQHDANDSIRHDAPRLDHSVDPRDDLRDVTLDRNTIVDVKASVPVGHTVEQALPVGIDGKPLALGPNHHGVGDHPLLEAHLGANSPLDMQRGQGPEGFTPDTGGAMPPGFVDKKDWYSAPTGGKQIAQAKDRTPDQRGLEPGGTKPNPKLPNYEDGGKPPPGWEKPGTQVVVEAIQQIIEVIKAPAKGLDNLGSTGDKKMENPEATGPTVITEAEVERAIAVRGGNTKPVEGAGGAPTIDADNLPKSKFDPVTDPIEPESPFVDALPTMTPPDTQIIHTINPDSGFTPRTPSTAPPAGKGDGGGDGKDPLASVVAAPHVPALDLPPAFAGNGVQGSPNGADLDDDGF